MRQLKRIGYASSLAVLVMGVSGRLLAGSVPGLYFTNAVTLPNGLGQFELVAPRASDSFALLYSFDLTDWGYWTTLSGNSRYVIQTPEPITAIGEAVFVQAAPLGQAINKFTFDFRWSRNVPLVNGTPTVSWPQSLDSWQAALEVGNSTNLPPAAVVTFTGPGGSGLVNLPAEFWPDDDYSGTYESGIFSLPPVPPGGTWSVAYGATNFTVSKPDPQVANRFVVVVPSFVVSNGVLTSMSWSYRQPGTGAGLGARPNYITRVGFALYGPDYSLCGENDNDIYYREFTNPGVTNFAVTPPIPWSNPLWQIEYEDDLRNKYSFNYSFGNLYEVYGVNSFSGVDYCSPTNYGFKLLGSATSTTTFTGAYNYYLIRAPKHNVVKVDTVRGSNGSYYGTTYTGNTANWQYIGGTPDGQFATLGQTSRGFYTGGFFVINALGHGISSVTVYTAP